MSLADQIALYFSKIAAKTMTTSAVRTTHVQKSPGIGSATASVVNTPIPDSLNNRSLWKALKDQHGSKTIMNKATKGNQQVYSGMMSAGTMRGAVSQQNKNMNKDLKKAHPELNLKFYHQAEK